MSFHERIPLPVSAAEIDIGISYAYEKYGCSIRASNLMAVAGMLQLKQLERMSFQQALRSTLDELKVPYERRGWYKSAIGKIFNNRAAATRRGQVPKSGRIDRFPVGTQFKLPVKLPIRAKKMKRA